jgi:hypothetical protein
MPAETLRRSVGLAIAALAVGAATTANAQAPATAQVWDVRYVVDSTGPFAAGPTATQVGITMFARVGILPNTSSSGTTNFGLHRVGGNSGTLTFRDATAHSVGASQGRLASGQTFEVDGLALEDVAGSPLTGHRAPFRGTFAPGFPSLGSNTDPSNGLFSNSSIGPISVRSLFGERTGLGVDSFGPLGVASATTADPATLDGELTPNYRLHYFPTVGLPQRTVVVEITGVSARYRHAQTSFGIAPAVPIPDQTITFLVPSPSATALVALPLLTAARRRRR